MFISCSQLFTKLNLLGAGAYQTLDFDIHDLQTGLYSTEKKKAHPKTTNPLIKSGLHSQ